MPSVGMRRSTRVFGARVLRSGRRLWTKPHEGSKNIRTYHVKSQWTELLENSADIVEDSTNTEEGVDDACKGTMQENPNNVLADVEMEELGTECVDVGAKIADRMCGIVYTRKRKRADSGKVVLEDRRYGKKFFRKQWRKISEVALSENCGVDRGSVTGLSELAVVVNGPSFGCGYWITRFLTTVLSYMSRVRIGVREVYAFLVSEHIHDAYSSGGVLFLQDSTLVKNPGICVISGSDSLIPSFSLTISSIASFFMHMQTSTCIRSAYLSCFLVAQSVSIYEKDEKVTDVAEYFETQSVAHSVKTDENNEKVIDMTEYSETYSFEVPSYVEQPNSFVVLPHVSSGRKELSQTGSIGIGKSALRSLQSRSSRRIQKRRSSFRRKKGRSHSGVRPQKSVGTLAADFFRIRQESAIVSPAKSSPLAKNVKELRCTVTEDVFISGCCVNLLVTEADRCFRVEGAAITLELSASKLWFLAIKKDGKKKYSLTAEKVMRPPWTNRFSHATIFAVDGCSKLEFANKHDFLIFKELYKECYERNMLAPATSVIPVPSVQEVSRLANSNCKPYVRPDSYILMREDELTRALARKSAIYDMDSDDEAWLAELNHKLYGGEVVGELVTHESFESIIDALEKGSHCNPWENFDEQGLYDFCMHLERKEVIDAVHSYWVKKRKQKRVALVKIFQLYQPRRIQVIPKSVLRKKRSFKRQVSQVGRGKQRPNFPAIVAEQDTLVQQNNTQKLQEAKAAAGRFEDLAILKRQKAQMLMANADLATYKAFVALRIAEAAQMAKHSDDTNSFLAGSIAES